MKESGVAFDEIVKILSSQSPVPDDIIKKILDELFRDERDNESKG